MSQAETARDLKHPPRTVLPPCEHSRLDTAAMRIRSILWIGNPEAKFWTGSQTKYEWL